MPRASSSWHQEISWWHLAFLTVVIPGLCTRVAQKVMAHVFFRNKYLLKTHVNNAYSSEKVYFQTHTHSNT
jgi:hypothetical protein